MSTQAATIVVSRVFVDEDNNCGIYQVDSACRYRVTIARNGKITVAGNGCNFQTSRAALHAGKFDLQGLALLAVITWEHSPTGGA